MAHDLPAGPSQSHHKAGAVLGEALGEASSQILTDRLIHTIDGLRKSQEEDKTGTKGTLTSIKENERLDVFLARGCDTQVELCAGSYGKELFHSIKRAGHHGKRNLQLIKWPVLITNMVALAIGVVVGRG